jgi:hypothetical protein
MKKEITINLTHEEIEALQISICANQIALKESIDHLKEHNKTGINTNMIRKKAELINKLDVLFDKLHKAEQLIG